MRDIKIKYVYSNGSNIFTKCFALDQIEAGDHFNEICDCPLLRDYKIIDRLQYTGLKDKNGKEIFEGDIVGPCSNGWKWIIEWGCFGDTGFYGYNQLNTCRRLEPQPYSEIGAIIEITEDNTMYCEVIGNIHENPEYLEQQK